MARFHRRNLIDLGAINGPRNPPTSGGIMSLFSRTRELFYPPALTLDLGVQRVSDTHPARVCLHWAFGFIDNKSDELFTPQNNCRT